DGRQNVLQRLDLWNHSLAVAIAAQILAPRAGVDSEVAFTTGLLHDLGKISLAQMYGQGYTELIEEAKKENLPLYELERQNLQIDHARACARLLEGWNFPTQIVSAIESHHEPFRPGSEPQPMALVASTANSLAYRIAHGYGYPPYAVYLDPDSLAMLELDTASLEPLEVQLVQTLEEEQARFR